MKVLKEFNDLLRQKGAVAIVKPKDKDPSCVIGSKDTSNEFVNCLEKLITEVEACDEAKIRNVVSCDYGYIITMTVGIREGIDTWPVQYELFFASKY